MKALDSNLSCNVIVLISMPSHLPPPYTLVPFPRYFHFSFHVIHTCSTYAHASMENLAFKNERKCGMSF